MSNNQNVDSIFLAAAEMQSERQRAAYLRDACGDDATIRARVEQLLEAHVDAGEFMQDDNGIAATIETPLSENVGDRIGPYKLLQEIGEGGFGVVYMAEQIEPVRRKVALKIIKPGMDTKEVIARFEAERQALALMDHPNIAKVHDGGATETGRPYFVMELVKGVPITEYCDKNKLSTKKRLELFVTVCRAIQHAHQKGIIHRDLKPSNVMVTLHDGEPVPKVIDFGVAKATSQQLTERTLFTAYGQMIGTPLYMSPEQAEMSGLDVDTRSDVYSLGVLLYELLAGTTPFDGKRLREAGYVEMQRIIREEAPPSPSMRLSTLGEEATIVSGHRSTDCGRLRQILRGDLDVIVMKTLEKNRDQRYESASSFAEDLERFLRQEAIFARPPSPVYRLRKYVQRNRSRLGVGTVVLTAFVVCVVFGWIAIRNSIRGDAFEDQVHQATLESSRKQKAREVDLPRLEQLVEEERPVPAFRLARELREVIPTDPALAKLWEELTIEVTFNIDPEGARILVRDWDGGEDDWLEIGCAPLTARVPDGNLRWRFECEGYETRERQWQHSGKAYNWLWPKDRQLRHMVRIPKRTVGKRDAQVFVPTFVIDRHEVTNGEFQHFVDVGGYDRPEFWDQEFLDQRGEPISRETAMDNFRDTTTGSPGPAVWKDGRFPDGEENSPVRGVSWYEAMAYAKFAGKSLPTVHHWRSARTGSLQHMVRFSNFSGEGPAEVEANRGIGVWGVYDMAGNVKEWCSNQYGTHERTLRGADWNGPSYLITSNDHAPPISRDETIGFRCVMYVNPPSQESLASISPDAQSNVPPATEEQIKNYKEFVFSYARDLPLNEEQVVSDMEADADYRHDVWRIDAAYGNEQRFDIHLFVPREGRAPFETVVWFTGSDALTTNDFEDHKGNSPAFEFERRLVRTGRMVVVPIFQGTYERTSNARGRWKGKRRQELFAEMVKDLSRTVDFLEARPEADSDRLIYAGLSFGAALAPMNLVIEERFKAALLVGVGHGVISTNTTLSPINAHSYMPHVKTPTLVLNGLYDTVFPVDDSQLPFFDDLGSIDKQLKHYESEHLPPADEAIRFADEWLKSRLSPEPRQ